MILTEPTTVLRLDDLEANPDNPRQTLGDVTELAESIRALGLLQPLIVVEIGGDPCGEGGTHMVVDGHRRLAALQQLDFDDEIPVRVVDLDLRGRILTALATQGRPLDPIEEATAFGRLVDLGMTQRQIADEAGCNQSHVSRRLALLGADDDTKAALTEGKVTVRQAEAAATGKPGPKPGEPQTAAALRRENERLRTLSEQVIERSNAKSGRIFDLEAEVGSLRVAVCELYEFIVRELDPNPAPVASYITEPDAQAVATAAVGDDNITEAPTLAMVPIGGIGAVEDEEAAPASDAMFEEPLIAPPWPGYDAEPADKVIKYLNVTIRKPESAKHILTYELRNANRAEVVAAAEVCVARLGGDTPAA